MHFLHKSKTYFQTYVHYQTCQIKLYCMGLALLSIIGTRVFLLFILVCYIRITNEQRKKLGFFDFLLVEQTIWIVAFRANRLLNINFCIETTTEVIFVVMNRNFRIDILFH